MFVGETATGVSLINAIITLMPGVNALQNKETEEYEAAIIIVA